MRNQLQIVRVSAFLGEELSHLTLGVTQIDKPEHEILPKLQEILILTLTIIDVVIGTMRNRAERDTSNNVLE